MTNGWDFFAQTIITGNLVLVQGLGIYALIKYTDNVKTAAKNGLTTLVAMGIGGLLVWMFENLMFVSLGVKTGLYLIIGVVAAFSAPRILGMRISFQENMYQSALVGSLLLLGTEGVVAANNLSLPLGAGLGYLLTLVVMATLRKRLELAPIPKALKGAPIILITAGLLAIALLGFRF
ncbi:MAG: Rnf-Nqr domain containing protein [Bacillota bacterium]|nr:Rnf-Nqr domain containing protein [Bacillota bacterium]HHU61807.1 hypothetical protein [Natronincola sp.]